ncbi:MAG: aldose epimerase family protein, partial [Opitutales bacterium]
MMTFQRLSGAALAALVICCASACGKQSESTKPAMNVSVQQWGNAPDGTPVQLYTLCNGKGMTVRISTWGGVVQSIDVPDRSGKPGDVVLGFESVVPGYAEDSTFQGAAIGRYGNRIAKGRFTIDGTDYQVTQNEGENSLHGGKPGYDKVVWDAKPFECDAAVGVTLHRLSPDGENGYPGNLDVSISYSLNQQQELQISYTATTDKATPVNLTHHMYYNLSGSADNSILGDELQILADRYTPVDAKLIPTGELRPVDGTPFDFRAPMTIGSRIGAEDAQLTLGGGYDHNFIFANADGSLKKQVALYNAASGRVMEILTTEPAVQFYSGNFLSGAEGKRGEHHAWRHGL